MKSSIRFLIGCILAFGLSDWLSIASASTFSKFQSKTSPKIEEYSSQTLKSSISLKWPLGSLIFPESNDPNKANEVSLFNETFTSQSELQSLHQHLGLQLFSRKKYNAAKKEYLKALKFKPNTPATYKNLGVIYFNSKSYKRAERAYRKALELNPGYTPALAKLALTLAAQKNTLQQNGNSNRRFKQNLPMLNTTSTWGIFITT